MRRGLPVTSIVRTIGDLATAHLDGGHLAEIARDAVVQGRVQLGDVAQVLSPHARNYGAPAEMVGIPVHVGEIAELTVAPREGRGRWIHSHST